MGARRVATITSLCAITKEFCTVVLSSGRTCHRHGNKGDKSALLFLFVLLSELAGVRSEVKSGGGVLKGPGVCGMVSSS